MNDEKNQNVSEHSSYILIEIDYDNKLIFPKDDGLLFMSLWANALGYDTPYSGAPKLKDVKQDFKIRFMSEREVKGLMMKKAVFGKDEKEDD